MSDSSPLSPEDRPGDASEGSSDFLLGPKENPDGTPAKGTPAEKDYNEKKDKIAREAFLAVRSRTGADFVTYFTGTLCSVSQRVGHEGYLELARALGDDREVERVRSLTLLALSAA